MIPIRTLFDAGKDIQRAIEKVITYQASQEQRLKGEISEYIVTESIEQQLEQLLEKMQVAMESGSSHEIGVWVSGFYGSGKSSFTKYLGFAFDERVTIDGKPFLRYLQDRLHRPTTKALLSKLAASFPAAVVMLDLASEQIAGASLAEVSTVLYYKVLQYAGYSRNLKVAALERRLRKEGRYAVEEAFRHETGEEWAGYRNDELVVDSVVPPIGSQALPKSLPHRTVVHDCERRHRLPDERPGAGDDRRRPRGPQARRTSSSSLTRSVKSSAVSRPRSSTFRASRKI